MSAPRPVHGASRAGALDRWVADVATRSTVEILLGAALGELRDPRGLPSARRHLAHAADVLNGEVTP